MSITTVTKKGQITIPADVRKQLKIRESDRLEVTVSEGAVLVRKLPQIAELKGSIKVNGSRSNADWKEIEASTARSRGRKGA